MQKIRSNSTTTLADIVKNFKKRGAETSIKYFNSFRVFKYSYADLYDLSHKCAAYFQQIGLQKGDRILFWSPNCPEWVILQNACALTGVISVPLDIRNEPAFIQKIQDEVEAKYLFRTQYKPDPGLSIQTIYMENLLDLIKDVPAEEKTPVIAPSDWISIFYTSGTTGKPKGVILTHENITINIIDIDAVIHINKDYHLLSVLPLSHALEHAAYWAVMYGGGYLLYIKTLKPSALFEMFQREEITLMVVVPRLLAMLKQNIENVLKEKKMEGYLKFGQKLSRFLPHSLLKLYFYPIHKKIGTTFKFFVSGGAYLPPDVEQFWRSIGFKIIQGYGLTETSPILCANEPLNKFGSVGPAVGHVELKQDAEGEIWAKGRNVFQGYYKQPEATAAVFQDGWFKTGDVAVKDEDGYYFIRSRKKDIIVTADGLNIYPEDIETILGNIPGVKESCVIGIGEREEIIHASLILQDGINLEDCIKTVNQQLQPEQRIESYSIWPEKEFPKTTTLKIKKNEVRKSISQPASQKKMEMFLPMETPLHQILRELGNLQPEALRPDAKIGQDLGFSSIDRVELISRMEEEFRMDIDDQMVTAETTISEIEDMIEKRGKSRMQLPFRRWTLNWPCHLVREFFRNTLVRGLLNLFCDTKIQGLEYLNDLKGPVLFVANHTSHVDTPLIARLVPYRLGNKICPAASKEYFDTEGKSFLSKLSLKVSWNLTTTLFNIFPMAQTVGYRQSIVYAGELADKGWNILLFPEGTRTEAGEIAEFMQGVGLMVRALQIPLVPVAIIGGEKILHRGNFFPRRGEIKIAFGKPFFPEEKSYREITLRVKAEILSLLRQLEDKKTP